MQFRKLLYFLNLFNALRQWQQLRIRIRLRQQRQRQRQRQCHCHFHFHQRCYNRHHNQDQHHYKTHQACKWNSLLTFLTFLIALPMVTLATSPMNPTEHFSANSVQPEYLDNVVELGNPKSVNDKRNPTDNFERIVLEQLKREQKLRETFESDAARSDGNYDAAMVSHRKMLLSRKRRYLLFPEGSSFQLVYDGIIGVVDYTNYLILGITLALAWELPYKPPSEMLEDIKMQLNEGNFLLQRNDTAKNITYVDTKPIKKAERLQQLQRQFSKPNYINFAYPKSYKDRKPYDDNQYTKKYSTVMQSAFIPPMHRNFLHYSSSQSPENYYHTNPEIAAKYNNNNNNNNYLTSYSPYYYGRERLSDADWRRKDNNYYNRNVSHKPAHPFTKWLSASPSSPYSTNVNSKYPWWNLTSRLTNALRRRGKQSRPVQASKDVGRQLNNINHDYRGIWKQQERYRDRKGEREKENEEKYERKSTSGYYQSNAPTTMTSASNQRKHRIYPVFGKRSLSDTINPHFMQRKSPAGIQCERPHFNQQEQQKQKQKPKNEQEQERKEKNEHQNEVHHRQHQHQHRQHNQHRPPSQRRRCGIIDNDELSKFDRIHIRHHRRTRHTLYEKIEKYLDKRGSHGHHCVLRALCETGQKANEREPGSFLGELMRAVFTMPEPVEDDLHPLEYKETRYDAAHSYNGNCATRYFHCKESLWKSHFIA